jgi:hypothetical protein
VEPDSPVPGFAGLLAEVCDADECCLRAEFEKQYLAEGPHTVASTCTRHRLMGPEREGWTRKALQLVRRLQGFDYGCIRPGLTPDFYTGFAISMANIAASNPLAPRLRPRPIACLIEAVVRIPKARQRPASRPDGRRLYPRPPGRPCCEAWQTGRANRSLLPR